MSKKLVSGNEAVAIGVCESGVAFATAYPGAPCTEILEYLFDYKEIDCEWSTNEKVALEVAIGVSFSGKRSLVVMKTLGLNVAADVLTQYAGTMLNGGLIIVVADDVNRIVGDDYQDCRNYGIMSSVPVIEPADSEEARYHIQLGYEISEKYSTPVILRLNSLTCKSKTVISSRIKKKIEKNENIRSDYCGSKTVTNVVRFGFDNYNSEILEKYWHNFKEYWEAIKKDCNRMKINYMERHNDKMGIICSGVDYFYVKEVLPEASILKLGMVYPLPENLINDFQKIVDRLYIIEGGHPLIEKELKAMGVKAEGIDLFPRFPDMLYFTPDIIEEKLAIEGQNVSAIKKIEVPFRIPTNCPGCPHLFINYILKKNKIRVAGGIGCGGLGALPHIKAVDIIQCMGSSFGITHGFNKTAEYNEQFVGVMGDGEFWHTGINNLVNCVYNKGNEVLIIEDNCSIAMTGGQGNPSSGDFAKRETNYIDIKEICECIGVKDVKVIDPYDVKKLESGIKNALDFEGVSVIIAKRPCLKLKKKNSRGKMKITDKCIKCGKCLEIACLAIEYVEEKVVINSLCVACGLCQEVCPEGAIIYEK